jgi:coiled-coil domain-containing protein 39
MERKVDRMRGNRTEEEKTKLSKEIETLQKDYEKVKKDLQLLTTSNK